MQNVQTIEFFTADDKMRGRRLMGQLLNHVCG